MRISGAVQKIELAGIGTSSTAAPDYSNAGSGHAHGAPVALG
jgi:hypothetical protein